MNLRARSGAIQSSEITLDTLLPNDSTGVIDLNKKLQGLKIHQVEDFTSLLPEERTVYWKELRGVTRFLNAVFGIKTD